MSRDWTYLTSMQAKKTKYEDREMLRAALMSTKKGIEQGNKLQSANTKRCTVDWPHVWHDWLANTRYDTHTKIAEPLLESHTALLWENLLWLWLWVSSPTGMLWLTAPLPLLPPQLLLEQVLKSWPVLLLTYRVGRGLSNNRAHLATWVGGYLLMKTQ